MAETAPQSADREVDRSRRRYVIAFGAAAAAVILAAFVAGVMVAELGEHRMTALTEAPHLAEMRAEAARNPKNRQLLGEIRRLDAELRADYFAHLTRSRYGNVILLAAVAVFVIAARSALAIAGRVGPPGRKPADVEREMALVRRGRRAVVTLAVILLAAALTPMAVQAYVRLTTEPPPPPHAADPAEVARNWPRFRGPAGQGISAFANVPLAWDGNTSENVAWKSPVPLPGKSSPVVWGDRVFLTGATRERREVYCYAIDTGELLWTKTVEDLPGSPVRVGQAYQDTGYAAPTPVCDDERVFAIFANGDLACFDHEGNRVWAKAMGQPNNPYSHGSSLAMHRNLVLVLWDQGGIEDYMSKLIAFDGESGRVVWERRRPVSASWATPCVVDAAGTEQLLTSANPWVISYDPESGQEIWRAKCMEGGDVASSPVCAEGIVYAVSAETELYAVSADGKGDVTKSHVLWHAYEGLPDLTSPLTDGKHVWLLETGGMLTCYDAKTGEKRYDHAFEGMFNASPSLIGERLLLISIKGEGFIVATGPAFDLQRTNKLGEQVYASPALLDGRMILRAKKHLYCIQRPAGEQ